MDLDLSLDITESELERARKEVMAMAKAALRAHFRHALYGGILQDVQKLYSEFRRLSAPNLAAHFEELFVPLLNAGHELTDEPKQSAAQLKISAGEHAGEYRVDSITTNPPAPGEFPSATISATKEG